MILTDADIRAASADPDGGIGIEPFDADSVQPASYDLRVGAEAAVSSLKAVVDLESKGFVTVEPGDFVIVSTMELLRFDNRHVGRFGLMSSYSRRGLIATVGPQIDPGFRGRLFVGLTNLTRRAISLPHGDPFLSVEFHRLEKPSEHAYNGPFQDREKLSPHEIRAVMDHEYLSQTDMMRSLEALVSTVGELKDAVAKLEGLPGVVEGIRQNVTWRYPLLVSAIVAAIILVGGFVFSLV